MDILSKIPKKSPDIASRIIDEEAIIISLGQSGSGETIEVLNFTGTKIWELIDGKKSVSEIVRRLTETHDEPGKIVEADVVGFFNKLLTSKFVYF